MEKIRKFIKTKLRSNKMIDYNQWWKVVRPSDSELASQKTMEFAVHPLISVVVPAYNTPEKFLADMIESVIAQTYSYWELCIADGCSTNPQTIECLKQYEKKDARIHIIYLHENKGISGNTNEAIRISNGDYIAFLDHDDLITPDALFEVVKAINKEKSEFIYSDEDKILEDTDFYFYPHFKPDFSPDKLRSCNYICHLFVVSKNLLDSEGLLNGSFDGSQDHELALRLSEKTKYISHIPKILYHWRHFSRSMSKQSLEKCQTAGRNAVLEHIIRFGMSGIVEQRESYRVKYDIHGYPFISIIVQFRGDLRKLKSCLDTLLQKSSYKNIEIILANNTQVIIPEYYLETYSNIRIVTNIQKNDYSLLNEAANRSDGKYLVFINDDIEIGSDDWLQEMLMFAQRKDVGAVGGKIFYKNNTIKHAGYLIGIGGICVNAFENTKRSEWGYFGLERFVRNMSAVSNHFMMTRKETFETFGRFDEVFNNELGDIDYCLRLLNNHLINVYTPYAEAYSTSTNQKQACCDNDTVEFEKKWGSKIEDKFYNPNLTQKSGNYSLNMDLFNARLNQYSSDKRI